MSRKVGVELDTEKGPFQSTLSCAWFGMILLSDLSLILKGTMIK